MGTWDPQQCNDTSGFLFKHACDMPPATSCDHCRKPICSEHAHAFAAGQICTECMRKERRRNPNAYDESRGYYYGEDYYHGYGDYGDAYWAATGYAHISRDDENDFTEADSESLMEEDMQDFESDMGAS